MTDHLVLFMPSGKRGRFPEGTSVIDAARKLGVYVESVCGGRATCGRCQVSVQEGQFAKHQILSRAENISAPGTRELRYAQIRGLDDGCRLACSAQILGDVVIDVKQDANADANYVRKDAVERAIERFPAIRLRYIDVAQPDLAHPTGDMERLLASLRAEFGLAHIDYDFRLLGTLQKTLREEDWSVTAAIAQDGPHQPARLIAVWPGLKNDAYGIACDIGSTTIALHLVSLLSGAVVASAGMPNPQIRFGEDLMSRVSYVMMNPDGREAMTDAVQMAINDLVGIAAQKAGITREDILDSVFVANPVMHHLFLGIDPTELGGAPFALATSNAVSTMASEINLALHPSARLYMPPCIAGHVGADAAAVVLSESPHRQDQMMLVVDVGTNAEIILGNKNRVVAASSPTGPAFEGAEISCGQRAAPGAIERIRIDRETLEPRFKVIGCDLWSDEVGFAASVAQVGVTGICGSGIIEIIAELFLAGIITEDGIIDGALAARSPRVVPAGRTFAYVIREDGPRLTLTQNDVRAIQLAKAALYAGIKLLMDKLGIETVDTIRLAGAFGTFIDPAYAMTLGMIPDCNLEAVSTVGNAAGTGARMALLNTHHRREIENTVTVIEKVETALEPMFQQHFVHAMAFPNKTDTFPKLSRMFTLPERQNGTDPSLQRRRTNRRRETS